MKIMASGPITSWEINGETVETVSDFIFLGSKTLNKLRITHSGVLSCKQWTNDSLRGFPLLDLADVFTF